MLPRSPSFLSNPVKRSKSIVLLVIFPCLQYNYRVHHSWQSNGEPGNSFLLLPLVRLFSCKISYYIQQGLRSETEFRSDGNSMHVMTTLQRPIFFKLKVVVYALLSTFLSKGVDLDLLQLRQLLRPGCHNVVQVQERDYVSYSRSPPFPAATKLHNKQVTLKLSTCLSTCQK